MSVWQMLRELAQAPFAAAKKTQEKVPAVKDVADYLGQIAETPGTEVIFPPVALTRTEALTKLLAPQKMGLMPPGGQQEIYNLAKIIMATPERYLSKLRNIVYAPSGYAGSFLPGEMKLQLAPWARFQTSPGRRIYETLSHELGHLAMDVDIPHTEAKYMKIRGSEEALADWLAKAHAKRAGLPFTSVMETWEKSPLQTIRPQVIQEMSPIWSELSAFEHPEPYKFAADHLTDLLRGLP